LVVGHFKIQTLHADCRASQGPPAPQGGRPPLMGLKIQSDANTAMKSRVSC